jgi:fumarylacetoacetate (FAA) hydrolase
VDALRPPSIRDFYAFEGHVRAARARRGLEMDPGWYDDPVFYFSNPAVVLADGDEVRFPARSAEWDYELEVALVIAEDCSDVPAAAWRDVAAGFTIMNDWSARDLQRIEMKQGLGPAKGKDFATSLGPRVVPVHEVPAGAAMVARVNGAELSRGVLSDMHFGWGRLVEHASRDTLLRAGDVLGSGTVGTGCLLELGLPWLREGDAVELEVDGIGVLGNRVGPPRGTPATVPDPVQGV